MALDVTPQEEFIRWETHKVRAGVAMKESDMI